MPEIGEIEVDGHVLKVRRYLPDDLVQRVDAADVLCAPGLPTTYNQLCQWAARRMGPPYIRRGRLALYRHADLKIWAEEQLNFYPKRVAL